MTRGLNRQRIFHGPGDYEDFLKRLPIALERSPNEILAWALMPNHVHFFVRSGKYGIAPFFRRLFTGYAMAFNRRHRRVGYLFQSRYKSIVCDQEEYFMTLVRYIHLNPLVGGVVSSLSALDRYRYCGHSALMNNHPWEWQAIDEVLGRFGRQAGSARKAYLRYLQEGIPNVKTLPTDLLGGGLLESLREHLGSLDREEDRTLFDPRVLGESDFVQRVWQQVDEREERAQVLKRRGVDLRDAAKRIAQACGIPERLLFMRGRQAAVSEGKAALIFIGIEYFGRRTREMASITQMSIPAAGKARLRGQKNFEALRIAEVT